LIDRSAPAAVSAASRLQILGAALLFSTGGAAIKSCTFTAWQVASFRSGVAALALLLVLPEARRRPRARTLVVGLAYAATLVLFVCANKLTTAANTIFLQATAPFHLMFLGPWLLREPLRRVHIVFAACLAVGLALFFVGAEPPQATAPDPLRGNVLAAASGLAWALTILGLRWLGRSPGGPDSPAAAVAAGNVIAFVGCLFLALPVRTEQPWIDWTLIAYLGVFQIGLAYVWLTRAVARLAAIEVALLLQFEPVLNAVWAWAIHGELPGRGSTAGCLVILAATVVFTLRGRR
jgi:drug/metabolite transporter (DMT)-like permease